MSEPFLAEIRIVGFNFAPRGWAFCDGQLLPINQNQSLYSLLGTTYGGDGRTSFALPDLRGRTPIHFGEGDQLGARGGQESVALSAAEMPQHDHRLMGTADSASTPDGLHDVLGKSSTQLYSTPQDLQALAAGAVATAGGNQAHENMQPFTVLNFCIALQGLFPSRN
jgi:microcystin-dependent protein